jgi:hypothetical protein
MEKYSRSEKKKRSFSTYAQKKRKKRNMRVGKERAFDERTVHYRSCHQHPLHAKIFAIVKVSFMPEHNRALRLIARWPREKGFPLSPLHDKRSTLIGLARTPPRIHKFEQEYGEWFPER